MSNLTENALNFLVDSAVNQFVKSHDKLTPIQQNYINIIRNRDAENGIPLANNLCNTMGDTKEQACMKASQFFHI